MRWLVASLVASLVVTLSGCGGGPERVTTSTTASTTPPVVPAARWRAQLEAACSEWNERYADLADAEPSSKQEAIEHAREVRELTAGLAGVLADAGLPDEGGEAAQRLVDRAAQLAEAAAELAAAASGSDGDAVDAAAERIAELADVVNPLADQLGVPACGGY